MAFARRAPRVLPSAAIAVILSMSLFVATPLDEAVAGHAGPAVPATSSPRGPSAPNHQEGGADGAAPLPPESSELPGIVPQSTITLSAFDGLRHGANGAYWNNWTPPDVQVAVGPDHVLEMVNLLGRIWTKQGGILRTFPLDAFFAASSSDFVSDPKVRYDALSGRWFATLTDVTTSRVLLAVSTSDDPTASWRHYSFRSSAGCADQPLIGISDGLVVLSANGFSSCTTNPSYVGVEYWVVNKTDLVLGASADFVRFGPDASLFSVQPAQSLGPTSTQFLVTASFGPSSSLTLYEVTGVPPGNVAVITKALPIRTTSAPPRAPQLGTSKDLDTSDARVQDAMWDAGRLWLALGVGCTPSGDSRERACLRLIEVDTGNATVAQDFDVGIAGKYVFYPALRTDGEGHLVVGFGYASADDYPGVMVAVRADGDPPNTIGAPAVIRAGTGSETSACPVSTFCRYGDYFGAARDPTQPGVVWIAGEVGTSSGWGTHLAAVTATARLTLNYSITGGGSGYTPPTFTYVHAGRPTMASLTTTPTVYAVDAGTAWSVPALLDGSGGSERWATDGNVTGVATEPAAATFGYTHQFLASFAYRVTGGGDRYAAPTILYRQFASPVSNAADVTDWADAGSPYEFPLSLDGSDAFERWTAEPGSIGGTVDGPGAIEVAYRHQAFVAFDVRGPDGASITPGTGWYDVGASLTMSVNPPAGWAIGEWAGTGAGAYSGMDGSPTVLVVGPFSETAVLFAGLTITAGVGGSVAYAYEGGSGTVLGGSDRTIFVRPGTNVSLAENASSSFAFGGWSGAGTGNQRTLVVTVREPMQVSATFASTQGTSFALYSAIGIVALIVAVFVVSLVRRRRREPPPPPRL